MCCIFPVVQRETRSTGRLMATQLHNTVLDRERQDGQPLYEQIRERIRESIHTSEFERGQRLPSVSSLVREWSVDPRTVKAALRCLEDEGLIRQQRGKGAYVVKTRDRAVQGTLLFVRWNSDPFCVGIERGAQKFGREIGAEPIIVDAGQCHENFLDVIAHPPAGVTGLMVLPFSDERYVHAVSDALRRGLKIVCVDRFLPSVRVSTVMADHFDAGYQGARHLIEQHGLPVHYIGTPTAPTSQMERTRGWAAAMQEHNFDQLQKYVWELPLKEVDSCTRPFEDIFRNPYLTAKRLFETVKSGTYCIYAGNDYIGKGVYLAAAEARLKIGRDVFIVGFGDMPLCTLLDPPMSSVHQDYEQIGYEAMNLLQQELSGAVVTPIRRVLPVHLCVRRSSSG